MAAAAAGQDIAYLPCRGQQDVPALRAFFAELLPAPYPALNASEVDAFCDGENAVQEAAHDFLYANGGMDGQACWDLVADFPLPADPPAACAAKLQAINLINSTMAVGFAMDRTGGKGYSDETAPQTVAAFLLTRKEAWFFGVSQESDTMALGTAALLLSDYGAPLGPMGNSTPTVFVRHYEKATVQLDCSTFQASFTPV